LFALFAFETVIYVVGTAFVIVVIAKERVVQVHKTAEMTDLLTGLFNRRAFLESANKILEQRARKKQPGCCSTLISSNRSTTASVTLSATTRSRCSLQPRQPRCALPT
jgi:hypothetical protein